MSEQNYIHPIKKQTTTKHNGVRVYEQTVTYATGKQLPETKRVFKASVNGTPLKSDTEAGIKSLIDEATK